jgi:hypothetical protein
VACRPEWRSASLLTEWDLHRLSYVVAWGISTVSAIHRARMAMRAADEVIE